VSRALWLASGAIVWSVHFLVIYGFTGIACAHGRDWEAPWVVGVATMVAALLALAIARRGWRRRGEFEHALSAGLAAFALLAILWEGLAVLLVAPCALR
jgi:hypothetical protein